MLVALALPWAGAVHAQETPETVAADKTAEFDAQLEEIDVLRKDVAALGARVTASEGLEAELFASRRDLLWTRMLKETLALARQVNAEHEAGRDVAAYVDRLRAELAAYPDEVRAALERVRNRAVFPSPDLDVQSLVVADQEFFRDTQALQDLYQGLVEYLEVAGLYGIDVTEVREFTTQRVLDHAANVSVFLTMAQDHLETLKAASATLPGDPELVSRVNAANTRISLTAATMQNVVRLLDALGQESRLHRRQLLSATGEITADVLDVGLVGGLLAEWGATAAVLARTHGVELLFRGLFIALILFAFWQLGKIVQRALEKTLSSSRVRISNLLKEMIVSMCRNTIFIIGLLLAISQMGVSLAPLLAGLGIAGFIIGFALQDTLSNFASGVMILIYRPFDVGDFVEAGGVQGKVSHMSLVNTTFMTLDNQRLVVPNNMIWQAVITNVTAQHIRRVDLVFGVSYKDDLDKVEKLLTEIVASHDAVLESPEPLIKLHELGDSSVNFIVRPWVRTEDYWDTYWDLTKIVKQRFDAEGITIPYPQRDVHMIGPEPA